jgi:DNA-binding MarR family transcriptional regulator
MAAPQNRDMCDKSSAAPLSPTPARKSANASTGWLFIQVYGAWHGAVKAALRELGVTHPQFVVMQTLEYLAELGQPVTQAAIAAAARMDAMTVSQVVRGLATKGYLERKPLPADARAYAVTLTDKGAAVVHRALPVVEAIDDQVFGVLGKREPELQALLRALIA